MGNSASKVINKKVIPHDSFTAALLTQLREHKIARNSMIDLYGQELVLSIENMIDLSGTAAFNTSIIQTQTSIFQQVLALHTAVRVCKQWEKDLQETPEFKEKKAYLIQVFSMLDKKDISILELLTSDIPIFREASYIYNKIKD